MENKNKLLLFFLLAFSLLSKAQDTTDYIEFNDRNNVVNGVYLGLSAIYGELGGEALYGGQFKIAYVADQKFEVGIEITGFQSDQQFITSSTIENKLTGGYVGTHLEPILFSKRKVSLSFPLFIGLGAIGYTNNGDDFDNDFIEKEYEDVKAIFVLEPGANALFNISRYLQLEAGIKYRITNNFNLATSPIKNFNGFSAGIGIKVGVFNMGRNRYKKKP
ncbi:hypothetical protein CLV91_1680 [Maribacter vaceletii]|uniref:Outer membrane protein with beta-barrel domain n=1 Tax=Maribacter vaceletii TaxID=1206816 RepID=A0A495E7R2_9FLAO|nr:hypothetical protein [Maribacter vaceletii]RKR12968.1 hypothetical protein CLV91_1680 [Maribacter vaceletii]